MIDINPQFSRALKILQDTSNHIFITGRAGTGKSTLLSHFRRTTDKPIAVLAPTGVAAVNVEGETIHSFFRFHPGITPTQARDWGKKQKGNKLYTSLSVLIIDEISMVRADLFDAIDQFLRQARGSRQPFGGLQLALFGDLYQLPPVVTRDEQAGLAQLYPTPYFFSSQVFAELSQEMFTTLEFVELDQIYRQTETTFIDLLNRIRDNQTTVSDLSLLNQNRVASLGGLEDHLVLTTINAKADQINLFRLGQLPDNHILYSATVGGDFSPSYYPAADKISLKPGARVMLINNDSKDRWINGTLATVLSCLPDSIEVQLDTGQIHTVTPHVWTVYQTRFNQVQQKLERIEVGSFTQFPLRLAWAFTIHKSQGKTFDKIVIDFGTGTFAHGQAYVALSRCTTLNGIKLLQPIHMTHLRMDPHVITFIANLRKQFAV